MALVTIKLKHCVWRAHPVTGEGRPRFKPGPKLRALGFLDCDLKHEDGRWLNLAEAELWAAAKDAEINAARAGRPRAKAPKGRARGPLLYTVADLFHDWFQSPRFQGRVVKDGKREHKPLAPATVKDYRKKARALEDYDGDLYHSAVEALTQPICFGLYEELWRDKGLPMARGMLAVLSAAIAWGKRRGKVKLAVNPCLDLGMQLPAPRVRSGEPFEMKALIAAADKLGRPEIGDAIMLGLFTGQRQNDRLQLIDAGLASGRRIFRQSKTGAIVAIREAPELEARLATARRRRQAWKVQPIDSYVVMDEQAKAPFKPDWYRHLFADVRAAALEACPTLTDFQERDLRDTAVTWLALAEATIPEIAAITGHSIASVHSILKHYLAMHPELADHGIAKMVGWYAGQT